MRFWTSGRVLLRETVIEGELVNEAPLRIGAEATVDLALIRIRHQGEVKPYIPGSSLKGVFRTNAGLLLSIKDSKIKPCDGLARSTCVDRDDLGVFIEKMLREGRAEEAMKSFFEKACLLCKVFGAPYYAGRVSFSDAYPIQPYTIGTRTGISIDRKTGSVYKGALYTVEYIELGAVFSFKLYARNLPNYVLGMLAATIRRINEGEAKIGGFKSRGFGKVRIEKLKIMNRDSGSKELKLPSLEEGVDQPIEVGGLARLEDGWLVAEGGGCQTLLKKLEEVWEAAKL
ncbi:MAG: CRISPR-associated RAMP protein [Thaumarchaeota archaeon]|nr:CRISPR-associated RAMP protein [Nitrososphaerota archaeon]